LTIPWSWQLESGVGFGGKFKRLDRVVRARKQNGGFKICILPTLSAPMTHGKIKNNSTFICAVERQLLDET
jgi:hypothetical protein